jgi:hypothetical protein
MKNNFLKIVMFLIFGFGFSQTPISLEKPSIKHLKIISTSKVAN